MGNKRGTRRSFGAIRRLPSGRYQAHYVGPDGAKHKAPRTFSAHDDAAAWCAHERRLIDLDVWTPLAERLADDEPLPVLTFEAYAKRWLEHRNLKPTTRSMYRSKLERHLIPTFGDWELLHITPDDVRQWHAELSEAPVRTGGGEGRTGATRTAHAYALLKTILGTAVEDGLIPSNPCRIRGGTQTKRAHEVVVLDAAEIDRLAAAMPDRLELLVTVSAWCGLRRGELLALRRRDVADDGTVVHVRRAVSFIRSKPVVGTPKSAAGTRDVAVPPHVVPAVVDHLAQHVSRGRDSLLFPAEDGGVLDEWTLRYHYKRAATEIGRPDLRLHDLRHQGAVMAARAGASVKELMSRLGHTSPQMSMRYLHTAAGRDAEIAARMSTMLEGEK